MRLGFYTNGDPYSYKSLQEHASQLTPICPEWFALSDGLGNMQIDADVGLPKLAAAKGLALLPLPRSARGYREAVADPYWNGNLILRPSAASK